MFTPTLPAAEGTSTAGPSEVAPALPPLPVKRSKPPASRSMNVVIQQILQSAVADVNSQLSGEQGGGEGEAGELEEEEDNAREDRDGSGSAYSSRSSEEGEEVYVLFNEDDSAHEDASALCESPLAGRRWCRAGGNVTDGDGIFQCRFLPSPVTKALNTLQVNRISGNTAKCHQVLPTSLDTASKASRDAA